MNKKKPLWSFERIVGISIDRVENFLFDVRKGVYTEENLPFILISDSPCIIKFRNGTFNVEFKNGHKEYIIVNRRKHEISLQGEWWYRGTYKLSSLNGQTRIVLTVYNIAPYFGWIVNIMAKNKKVNHEKDFENFIERLLNTLL